MTLNRQDPQPKLGSESSNVSAATATENCADNLLKDHTPVSDDNLIFASVPCPSSTFMIRSIPSENVITLQGGQILLAKPGSVGNSYWECVESDGWLGFRDPGSGRFLGHDRSGKLCCVAPQHHGWEHFCVRHKPEGGYSLLMRHWDKLWQVGIAEEEGVEKLAKIEDSKGLTWEFSKV